MKKGTKIFLSALLSVCSFIVLSENASAQWTSQSTGFAIPLNIGSISIVNDTIVWATANDSTTGQTSQMVARTTDGGNTWSGDTINGTPGFEIGRAHV